MTILSKQQLNALRFKRQHFLNQADEEEYEKLFAQMAPVQTLYWCRPGSPPKIPHRAEFDEDVFNNWRRRRREIVKGRFQGGNIAYVPLEDLPLYASAYRKAEKELTSDERAMIDLFRREGPMNIGLVKDITGLLAKEITPVLHSLQESFIMFEDQVDDDWDRGWFLMESEFPDIDIKRFDKREAVKLILVRYLTALVYGDVKMLKGFYRFAERDIKLALKELEEEGVVGVINSEDKTFYMLSQNIEEAQSIEPFEDMSIPIILNRNDIIVKSLEHQLKEMFPKKELAEGKDDILYYVYVNGEVLGAVIGRFRNGPYDVKKVVFAGGMQVSAAVEKRILEEAAKLTGDEE